MHISILEDEFFIAKNLERILAGRGHEIALYQRPKDILAAFKNVSTQSPLVLVDINLNDELDGIEVAQQLKAMADVRFVFITALSDSETIERLKELEPLAYIVKPYTDKEVLINLEIAMGKLGKMEKQPASVDALSDISFIKTSEGLIKVNLLNIRFVEAYDNYIKIHTPDGVHITKCTLKDFYEKTNAAHLVQIHRSYIVNIHKLDAIFGNMAVLGHKKLPIGKTYREQLDRFLII